MDQRWGSGHVQQGYRNNNIPVDVIVQDWQYWSPYVWGSHFMDPSRYPDPAAIVSQLHAANIRTMISIWPLYQTRSGGTEMKTGELANFNALNAINALHPTTTANGVYHFCDTFNAMARTLVHQQAYDRLIGNYGWDAIWADNTEPQSYPEGVNVLCQERLDPMGPMIQYAMQSADPLEIRVYAGADASFTIYEDEGDTYNYEMGQYSEIPLTWIDAAKTLTISARAGSYTGMLATRTFNVVFVGANHGSGVGVTGAPDQVVHYDGTQAVVTAP